MSDRRTRTRIVAGTTVALSALATCTKAADYEASWVPRFADLGMDGLVSALGVFDDGTGPGLYAGGAFVLAGDITVNGIARLDGDRWVPLAGGIASGNDMVWAMTTFDDGTGPALYVVGGFTAAGGQAVNHIARWDGQSWAPVGGGTNGMIRGALTVFDDGTGPALYVGGEFTAAGGVDAAHVAKWDGHAWSPVGDGMSGQFESVRALAVFDDGTGPALYAGGNFVFAGDVVANGIARWDGQSWSALGGGAGHDEPFSRLVRGLVVFDDGTGLALYATGQFTSAGGVPARGIARWDGTTWSALGEGLSADPDLIPYPTGRRLAVLDDGTGPALYVAGSFTFAGGQPANHVAKWDGVTWSALDTGTNGSAFAVAAFDEGDGPALFFGGAFTTAGGIPSLRIAKWLSRCVGDLDHDGVIDLADLSILLASFGQSGGADYDQGDLDHDGDVDLADLARLLTVYGSDCAN